MEGVLQAPQVAAGRGSETMSAPQEVQRMLALSALEWGTKRISRELSCSRNTKREYLRQGGWRAMNGTPRAGALALFILGTFAMLLVAATGASMVWFWRRNATSTVNGRGDG
jgi:hypothetical protein